MGHVSRILDTSSATWSLPSPSHWWANLSWLTFIVLSVTCAAIIWQSVLMRISSEAAEESARAAKDNTRALINSERAWILTTMEEIAQFAPSPGSQELVRVPVSSRNSGKTPGRVTRIRVKRHIVAVDTALAPRPGILPPEPSYDGQSDEVVELKELNVVVPPNGPFSLQTPLLNVDFNRLYNGEESLYIYGYIEYIDTIVFEEHITKFCYLYWPY